MKAKAPACVHCQSDKYVVLDRSAEKAGTILGGLMGAGAIYLNVRKESDSGIPQPLLIPGALLFLAAGLGSITSLLSGLLTGTVAGQKLGEQVDQNIRMKYRCRKCGRNITNG